MSRKTKRKQRDRLLDEAWTEWFTDEENFTQMMVNTCVFVEAAGTIGRAERCGAFDGLEPEALAALYKIVPRSRGGEGALDDAELTWGQWMIDVMSTPEGREAVAEARRTFEQRENEQQQTTRGRMANDVNVPAKQ